MLGGVRSIKGEKQMIYKNITFKAAPFSYDLTFDDRITLVGGDSGTGKTVLYEMLEDIRLTDEYKAIKLFNYKSDDFYGQRIPVLGFTSGNSLINFSLTMSLSLRVKEAIRDYWMQY